MSRLSGGDLSTPHPVSALPDLGAEDRSERLREFAPLADPVCVWPQYPKLTAGPYPLWGGVHGKRKPPGRSGGLPRLSPLNLGDLPAVSRFSTTSSLSFSTPDLLDREASSSQSPPRWSSFQV